MYLVSSGPDLVRQHSFFSIRSLFLRSSRLTRTGPKRNSKLKLTAACILIPFYHLYMRHKQVKECFFFFYMIQRAIIFFRFILVF